MGSFAKVIHYLRIYLDRHPDDTSVLFCLATLHARDGRLDEAARTLERVVAIEPENAEAARLLRDVRRSRARASAGPSGPPP
jgi:Flp pilus assembly protein TadD